MTDQPLRSKEATIKRYETKETKKPVSLSADNVTEDKRGALYANWKATEILKAI